MALDPPVAQSKVTLSLNAARLAVSRRNPRYDHGMTKVAKITISLPQEQAAQAREAVARGEAASVSSYISAALAAVAPSAFEGSDTLADLVADMLAEDGMPSPEAYAWADKVLGLDSGKE
jgi:Arc/MetJ-type ribon-helix-helix transcriptional regulator